MRRAAAAAIATLSVLSACGPGALPPPNVVLIVVDTLRADHLGAYGYTRATSPALDEVAAQGAFFETAIAPSSWSPPSHTTIITGDLPEKHHVLEWEHVIAPDVTTLASRLRAHGFATALFSSHLSLARGVGRFGEGFDSTFVTTNDQDAEVLRRAAEWVHGRRGPYFLQIILMTPHAPYTKYPDRLDGLFPDVPRGGEHKFPFVERRFQGDGGIPTSVALNGHHDAGYYINRYDRSVRHVDDLLSRFFRESGLADDDPGTLLVVTADHGEAFGEHGTFAHEVVLYDDLVRVPLLFRLPGRIPAGQLLTAPAGLVDIVPTVLGLVGAEPGGTDGVDLSALLTGRTPANGAGSPDSIAAGADAATGPDTAAAVPSPRFFTGSYVTEAYRRFMVRGGGYKLLRDDVHDSWELYDLTTDPGERVNLLAARTPSPRAQGAFASLEKRMRAELLAYANAIPALRRIDVSPDVREELRALGYVD